MKCIRICEGLCPSCVYKLAGEEAQEENYLTETETRAHPRSTKGNNQMTGRVLLYVYIYERDRKTRRVIPANGRRESTAQGKGGQIANMKS